MIQFICGQFVGKCFRHGSSNTGLNPNFQQLLCNLCPAWSSNRAASGDQAQRIILNRILPGTGTCRGSGCVPRDNPTSHTR